MQSLNLHHTVNVTCTLVGINSNNMNAISARPDMRLETHCVHSTKPTPHGNCLKFPEPESDTNNAYSYVQFCRGVHLCIPIYINCLETLRGLKGPIAIDSESNPGETPSIIQVASATCAVIIDEVMFTAAFRIIQQESERAHRPVYVWDGDVDIFPFETIDVQPYYSQKYNWRGKISLKRVVGLEYNSGVPFSKVPPLFYTNPYCLWHTWSMTFDQVMYAVGDAYFTLHLGNNIHTYATFADP